jgi:hypothetical protein
VSLLLTEHSSLCWTYGTPEICIETFDPEIKYFRFLKIGKKGSSRFT